MLALISIMVGAVFPGSFDPPTFGHLNIIERARIIFGEFYVVIADNKEKKPLFDSEKRKELLEELLRQYKNIKIEICTDLIVNFAREHNCKVLIRGIRSISDFSYEFELSILNKGINPEVETVFIPTDPRFFVLRSSAIKELASYGGDISAMVPPNVEKAVKLKYSTY